MPHFSSYYEYMKTTLDVRPRQHATGSPRAHHCNASRRLSRLTGSGGYTAASLAAYGTSFNPHALRAPLLLLLLPPRGCFEPPRNRRCCCC